jgi:CheY-like chemotaxis protein
MYRPPPLRGQPGLEGKTVLLIDHNQPTRQVRASVMRNHGVEVHEADSLQAARFLWQPNVYDLILLDVRRHLPGEVLEFYEQIRTASSKERFGFLVGPPVYLSRIWLGEGTEVDASQGQWQATVGRFLTAA